MTTHTVERSLTLFVTANTPSHLEWRALLEDFHLLDFAVTFLALESGTALIFSLNVTLVGETHEIRKVMNLNPLNRLVIVISLSDFLDVGTVCLYNFVTAHTGVARGNTGRE